MRENYMMQEPQDLEISLPERGVRRVKRCEPAILISVVMVIIAVVVFVSVYYGHW